MPPASPFHFLAAASLVIVRPERALTLADLSAGLRVCSDASVFHHTFRSLVRRHDTGFPNDFARWVQTYCREPRLAELLGGIDLRAIATIVELRKALIERVDAHTLARPAAARRQALIPFHFCEHVTVEAPIGTTASTLRELADGIRQLDLQTLHHHFINSRFTLRLDTHDFSRWVDERLGLAGVAHRLDRIDIYMNGLEDLRRQILGALRPEPVS